VFGMTDNEPHWLFALASVTFNTKPYACQIRVNACVFDVTKM